MNWGRFIYNAWLQRRTYYAITNRRILLLPESWNRNTQAIFLEAIPEITREGYGAGSPWMGEKLSPFSFSSRGSGKRTMSRLEIGQSIPVLAYIDKKGSVYRLILDLREKSRKPSA